jgi:hypothetical protein
MVPQQKRLEFEGGVISALFQQSELALACQWRRQIVPNGGENVYQSG